MIDGLENALQTLVLLVCAACSVSRAIRWHSRTWTLLAFFFGSWGLGGLYWTFCLVFYNAVPQLSVVSDLSWYASYIFLYMLLRQVAPPEGAREKRLLPWLGFVFTLGMGIWFCSFYVQWNAEEGYHFILWDKVLSNLIYAVLMGLLLFSALRRLLDRASYPAQKPFCYAVLAFCLLEYALWTCSCFWFDASLKNPYYWVDILLTASFLLFLPTTRKAVEP